MSQLLFTYFARPFLPKRRVADRRDIIIIEILNNINKPNTEFKILDKSVTEKLETEQKIEKQSTNVMT